jgi:hypothetical protein
MFNGTVLIALVLLTSACSNAEHYANADAFRAAVASWGAVGQSLDAAKAELFNETNAIRSARIAPHNNRIERTRYG